MIKGNVLEYFYITKNIHKIDIEALTIYHLSKMVGGRAVQRKKITHQGSPSGKPQVVANDV